MKKLNILFTSSGRRVSLIRSFRQALEELGWEGELIAADTTDDAPTRFVADEHVLVPRVDSPHYVDVIFDICQSRDISLVVPLIDPELSILAPHRERFQERGTTLLVSSPDVAAIAFDKKSTHDFFVQNGIDTPKILDAEGELEFPVFIKPARGSGSVGAHRIQDEKSLLLHLPQIEDPIVQEFIAGTEYTIDVLVDSHGKVHSVVPRRRIATRAGEVSKGVTEKSHEIIDAAAHVCEVLPGAFGPITLQCFVTSEGRIVFIEINPRFGGGFPLSHAAGADFPRWILQWVAGEEPEIGLDDWQDRLLMTRYDDAFFAPLPLGEQ